MQWSRVGSGAVNLSLAACISFLASQPADGAIVSRTITVDGDVTDWEADYPNPGDPAIVNVGLQTGNDGQFSVDGNGDPPSTACPGSTDNDAYDTKDQSTGTCVGLSGGVGRDLKTFAFTYDSSYIYLYVERFASSTSKTDWWFFIDVDDDGLMETTDVLYRVEWQGSNQNTDRQTWDYTPSDSDGDLLVGGTAGVADGYTMPGTISNRTILTSYTGGSADGLSMETLIPWSTICGAGCPPQSVRFHISSSNGTNLPNNIIDNMDGPGGVGGAIVILDLGITKTASESIVASGASAPTFTYTVTVTNNGGGDATDVEVTDVLDGAFTFVSSDQPSYDPDSADNVWNVGTLLENDSATMTIEVRPTGSPGTYANQADITDLGEADDTSSNDSASVNVEILTPDLTVTKSHAGNFAVGIDGSYSIQVQNDASAGPHTGQLSISDDLPDSWTLVSATGTDWLCGAPDVSNIFTCTYGDANTVLSSGASTSLLTVVVNPDAAGTSDNVVTVSVASGIDETTTSNNSATDSTTVDATATIADIAVSKSVDDATPDEDDNIVYTISITNNGPNDATGLTINDVLPAGVSYISDDGGGAYASGTGVWTIGTLTNGSTTQLQITGKVAMGTSGTTIINTAYLGTMNELDNVASNNSSAANIVPRSFDFTTSTKTVVDLNGGTVNPGDTLEYTISLIETGGVAATGLQVEDATPTNTSSLTVTSMPAGSTMGVDADLDLENISVAANGTETIVFTVVVDAAAPAFGAVTNSATITNLPQADVIVAAPTLVVTRSLTKELYLGPNSTVAADTYAPPSHPAFGALTMTRIASTSETGILVSGGTSVTWQMDPALGSALTIEDVAGASIPAQLVMSRAGGGSKSATVRLYSDTGCTGSGSVIADSGSIAVLASTPAVETFTLELASDEALAAGDCILLEVENDSPSKDFTVYPYLSSEGATSQVDLSVYNYINVDSVQVYDEADTGWTTPLTTVEGGDTVYFRAAVSDPFGYFDITSATFALDDTNLNVQVSTTAMTEESDDGGAIKYYTYPDTAAAGYTFPNPDPVTAPTGNWTATVTAEEGDENEVSDTGTGTIELIPFLPLLTVDKEVDDPDLLVDNGAVLVYSITIANTETGEASNVQVEDDLGEYLTLALDPWGNGTPFRFTDGATTAGFTATEEIEAWYYSIDGGFAFIDPAVTPLVDGRNGAASGYDGGVTDVRIIMDTDQDMDGSPASFQIEYEVKVVD